MLRTPPPMMTPTQIAEILQVTPQVVRKLLRTGKLKSVNVSRTKKKPHRRVTQEQLARFLEAR